MSGNPPRPSLLVEAAITASPEPLHENLGPHDRILYVGRLAPVPAPCGTVSGDLSAALAEIPDRRSRANGKR